MKPPKGETLTAKQLAWIKHVLNDLSDWRAYQIAYGCTELNAKKHAYTMRNKPEVIKELVKQREASFSGDSMGRKEKEAILAGIARRKGAKDSDIIRATNEHNRMTGDHEAVKVEISEVGSLVEMLRNGQSGESS
tara:strand:+ start:8254 stop:8658 length:405 start_codon:yes stop_codon:yes gene_type:complete